MRHQMAALVRRDSDRRWLSGVGSGSGERREKGDAWLCGRREEHKMSFRVSPRSTYINYGRTILPLVGLEVRFGGWLQCEREGPQEGLTAY
ncbi:hypothetical protein ACLB2K_007817 [Fragaria x ananassa]